MNELVEIRGQEFMCRQRALDEIAFHFRECNLANADSQAAH